MRDHINATLEHEGTQAFRCQPQIARDQAFCREVYNLPFEDSLKGEGYSISIVLNPNYDEKVDYYGGTCQIRSDEKEEFPRLQRQEIRETSIEPEIVIGGRAALREQEQDRQIVPPERDSPVSLDIGQSSPQTLEEYVQHCENLYPEQTLDKDQEQDLER